MVGILRDIAFIKRKRISLTSTPLNVVFHIRVFNAFLLGGLSLKRLLIGDRLSLTLDFSLKLSLSPLCYSLEGSAFGILADIFNFQLH